MSASMKCPKCGLVQMRRESCKACGATEAEPADSNMKMKPEPTQQKPRIRSWNIQSRSFEDEVEAGAYTTEATKAKQETETKQAPTRPRQKEPAQTLAQKSIPLFPVLWTFMGLFILVIAWMVYVPKETPSEIARRQVEEIRKRTETEMEEARNKEISNELIRRQQAERERRESEKQVIEVAPRVLSCLNAKSEAESLRQLRNADMRIAYCESLIEIEKAGGPRLPW